MYTRASSGTRLRNASSMNAYRRPHASVTPHTAGCMRAMNSVMTRFWNDNSVARTFELTSRFSACDRCGRAQALARAISSMAVYAIHQVRLIATQTNSTATVTGTAASHVPRLFGEISRYPYREPNRPARRKPVNSRPNHATGTACDCISGWKRTNGTKNAVPEISAAYPTRLSTDGWAPR